MRAPAGTLLRSLLLAVLLGLALAGCSDEPDQPGTLTSPTPSPTSSSASPTLSAEEQVEAAVREYYAELTRAAQTNDTSTLRTLTTKGCPCYRAVRVIDANAKQGERTPDARFVVTSLRVHDLDGDTALVEVRTSEEAYDVVDASGATIKRIPAQENHLDLSLVRTERDTWVIGNWFNLEPS